MAPPPTTFTARAPQVGCLPTPEEVAHDMPVVIALGALVTTLLGGLTALRVRDYRHLVLGAAAGLMLGVVAFDLLPEALAQHVGSIFGVPAVLLTFVLGFVVLHVVERSVALHRAHEREYAGHRHEQGVGLFAGGALVAHSVMDGFAIGAAFQAGATVALVVAVAVIAHDFADGFNTYTITALYGNDRRRSLTLLFADALAPLVGAAATLLVRIPAPALGLYLGFFAGVLLYLATADILPEAHADHPSGMTLLSTILGLGFMWLVIGLAS